MECNVKLMLWRQICCLSDREYNILQRTLRFQSVPSPKHHPHVLKMSCRDFRKVGLIEFKAPLRCAHVQSSLIIFVIPRPPKSSSHLPYTIQVGHLSLEKQRAAPVQTLSFVLQWTGSREKAKFNHLKQGPPKKPLKQFKCTLYRQNSHLYIAIRPAFLLALHFLNRRTSGPCSLQYKAERLGWSGSLLLQTEAALIGDYSREQIDYRYVLYMTPLQKTRTIPLIVFTKYDILHDNTYNIHVAVVGHFGFVVQMKLSSYACQDCYTRGNIWGVS